MQNLTLPHMYSKMLCLNNWDVFHKPAEKDCSPGVDAAETVRFSWKVVEPQGQREHDVRVSQAMPAWLFVHMDGSVKAAPS